ncbi:hypothetical protein BX661DRAFT_223837 [Kickxella alabastrina]|uniref:uncharacterized protein n=1 Tax=Kickxella alabastrina TaxID=61397 RepID=UPI00221F3F0F|nr:uncharacterized protein BX661DRAFT_223837 [Kickxella alabastrina]KAI7831079.1 hypothetical protein BX661DRAFT_223837 [Kickxella alabastrina]
MMSEIAPPNKTPPNLIGKSKTDGTFQTPQNLKNIRAAAGEWEPEEVRDKRRQRLLKCLGDNINKVDLFISLSNRWV